MARKQQNAEQELPFVALMDTMTNVVGVLTIVLVMIGISLARAAGLVFSSMPPATEEQVRVMQAELDRLRAEQESLLKDQGVAAGPKPTAAQLVAVERDLENLERKIKQQGTTIVDTDKLSRERSTREAELKQKRADVEKLMMERDRLKAQLDKTPLVKAPPPKTVRLPASRPIPKDSNIENIIVTGAGAYWIDIESIKAAFINKLKSPLVPNMVASRVKRDKRVIDIYDEVKVKDYFAKNRFHFGDLVADIVFTGWPGHPILKVVPRSGPTTQLSSSLLKIKNMPKTVAFFHVTQDGFENYLAARDTCDKAGVPAGWQYAGGPEYHIYVWEIETNQPKPKDPPKPPASSHPPQKDEIRAPGPKLD